VTAPSTGFLYSHGTYTTIDVPGALDTSALSINGKGQIVGFYIDPGDNGQENGFVYSHGTYTTLDVPGGTHTSAQSINDKGDVVGSFVASNGSQEGFLYSHGTYTILDFPGAAATGPESINDKGQVVGTYELATNGSITSQHSFVYSDGVYTTIDPPGGMSPTADSINNKGQIVGYYGANGTDQGFLASPVAAPKVGLGVDTFVFAPNSGHDTNTLLEAIQHPYSGLVDMQHAGAETVSTHDAGSTTALTDVHASNLHANGFHLV
jgi:probable HAF family extracellular repeat protein